MNLLSTTFVSPTGDKIYAGCKELLQSLLSSNLKQKKKKWGKRKDKQKTKEIPNGVFHN